jgi:phosphatidate phosphatase APP1
VILPPRLLAGLFAGCALATCANAQIATDERIQWSTTVAYPTADGRWIVPIEAWVFEPEQRPGLDAALAAHLGIDLDALDTPDRRRFHARTQHFRVDSERGKRVRVSLLGRTHELPPTDRGGRARLPLAIDAAQLVDADPTWITVHTADGRDEGRVLRVAAAGVSVVSDIDDTIKVSNVLRRRELLLNTFLREFRAVPGIAARYRQLAASLPTPAFHYVSASPLQLAAPLDAFIRDAGLPAGSLHLREGTAWNRVVAGSTATRTHKRAAIVSLLAVLPQRRFLLIGDSAEYDAGIYAGIARDHPGRILAIRIRDVGDPAGRARAERAFDGLPDGLAAFYRDDDPVALDDPTATR